MQDYNAHNNQINILITYNAVYFWISYSQQRNSTKMSKKDYQDAFGHEMYDYYQGKGGFEVIERDDGYIDISGGPEAYFTEPEDWHPHEREAMKYAKGRVLDIGCGAGRHSLYLQDIGFEVQGIDLSPLAIEVCRLRGLKDPKVMSISQINTRLGKFDTIMMLGNNFGLFGGYKRAKSLLRKLHRITNKNARIIAESNDLYETDNPFHLEYHDFNRKRGRMAGQIRLRVRYKKYISQWFDYLLVSKAEMEEILSNTGWEIEKYIDSEGSAYIAIIHRKG